MADSKYIADAREKLKEYANKLAGLSYVCTKCTKASLTPKGDVLNLTDALGEDIHTLLAKYDELCGQEKDLRKQIEKRISKNSKRVFLFGESEYAQHQYGGSCVGDGEVKIVGDRIHKLKPWEVTNDTIYISLSEITYLNEKITDRKK